MADILSPKLRQAVLYQTLNGFAGIVAIANAPRVVPRDDAAKVGTLARITYYQTTAIAARVGLPIRGDVRDRYTLDIWADRQGAKDSPGPNTPEEWVQDMREQVELALSGANLNTAASALAPSGTVLEVVAELSGPWGEVFEPDFANVRRLSADYTMTFSRASN